MQKTIIALFISLMTLNAFACSCADPNYTEEDRDMAVVSFMENKLGVDSKDLMSMNSEQTGDFLRALDRVVVGLGHSYDGYAVCEEACLRSMNGVYKYLITYLNTDEKECELTLKVTMKSNFFNSGYKSKVVLKQKPKCE